MLQGKRKIIHLTLGCLNRVEEAGAGSGGLKLEFSEKPRAAPSPEAVPSLSSVGWRNAASSECPCLQELFQELFVPPCACS